MADTLPENLVRGCEGVYSSEDLAAKLRSSRPLRIKFGMDPTAPDLHLGHCVVLRKLRVFQDLGHRAVLIIGDYTARIGDPTGRDITRPVLDEAAIDRNARTYLDQAGAILDTCEAKLEVRRNSEWLGALEFADVLRLTGYFTVQQMLQRDMFKKRVAAERQIVISEFMYPLMQAYDSVVVEADVELGGSDQTFNNLMGRELMGRRDMPRQVVMTLPLLTGVDGHEKMSKSKGNTVDVTDEPADMFGKMMSIPDALMKDYFDLLTDLPDDRIASLVDASTTHPREAKDILARILVESFRGRDAANAASEEFRRRFADHGLPDDLKTVDLPAASMGPIPLLRAAGFASSNSEARRLVVQGAVSLDGEKVIDPETDLVIAGEPILKVGKRRICRLRAVAES